MFKSVSSCVSLVLLLQAIFLPAKANLLRRVPQGAGGAGAACSFVDGAISFCESVTPGWISLIPASQAPCICYSSRTWVPNLFDGAIATCAAFVSTAIPTDYSIVAALTGFCSSVGNVLVSTGMTTATATRTTSGTATRTSGTGPIKSAGAVPSACGLVLDYISICDSLSPGFESLDPTSQAPCLCYDSRSWVPTIFDDAVTSCGSFVSTAIPSDYSLFEAFEGFCSSVGDVGNPITAGRTTGAAASSTGGGSTGGGSNRPSTTQGSTTRASAPAVASPSNVGDAGPGANGWSVILGMAATLFVFLLA